MQPGQQTDSSCPGWDGTLQTLQANSGKSQEAIALIAEQNKKLESQQSEQFLKHAREQSASLLLPPVRGRSFWGGDYLEVVNHPADKPPIDNSNAVVWSIQADASIMKDHGDIVNPKLIDFERQLYGDLTLPDVGH